MSEIRREQKQFYMNSTEWDKTELAAKQEGESLSEYIRIATKQRNEKVLRKNGN